MIVCGENMTRINFSASVGLFCLVLSACAGGNAIDEGVPSTAVSSATLAPLPPPAEPLAAPGQTALTLPDGAGATAAPVFPQQPSNAPVLTATAPPVDALVSGLPANTGIFPNSGLERNGATQQLSDQERDEKIAELRALQAQQQANVISPDANRARMLELQRLARTHSQDTIRTIEAQ